MPVKSYKIMLAENRRLASHKGGCWALDVGFRLSAFLREARERAESGFTVAQTVSEYRRP